MNAKRRTRIIKEIGDIIEGTCRKCEEGVALNKKKGDYSCPTCEHGIRLRELGDLLESKKVKEEPKVAVKESSVNKLEDFTIEEYNELRAKGMTDKQIQTYKDTTHAYLQKWKRKKGLTGVPKPAQAANVERVEVAVNEADKVIAEEVNELVQENERLANIVVELEKEKENLQKVCEQLEKKNAWLEKDNEAYISELASYESYKPESIADAVTHLLAGETVDLFDRDLRKNVIYAIRRMELWVDITHVVTGKLGTKSEVE